MLHLVLFYSTIKELGSLFILLDGSKSNNSHSIFLYPKCDVNFYV